MQTYQFQPSSVTISGPPTGIIFSTTFDDANFPDRRPGEHWRQSDGLSDSAVGQPNDGIAGYGAWVAVEPDRIVTDANNPSGGGGKGFRHFHGDGVNVNSGGIRISWPPRPEVWLRYYIRFQLGFMWSSQINMKTIYFNQNSPGAFYFGLHQNSVGGVRGGTVIHHSNIHWEDWMGGPTADGNWHKLEVHAKMESSFGSMDGVFEFKLNDSLIYSNLATSFGNNAGDMFDHSLIGSNANAPANGQIMFVDYDDIALSDSGWVG